MSGSPTRVRRNLKANQGRIIRVEQLVGRLERRIEKLEERNEKPTARASTPTLPERRIAQLEKQNENLRAELAKLRARLEQNTKDHKKNTADIANVRGLREPIQALVRSFKQTPGAPFESWRTWMLSTFRKQGLYRRQMFK